MQWKIFCGDVISSSYIELPQTNVTLYFQDKGNIHLRTGHEGPEGEQMYSSTVYLITSLNEEWVINDTPRRFSA